jgi:hypothetical protein
MAPSAPSATRIAAVTRVESKAIQGHFGSNHDRFDVALGRRRGSPATRLERTFNLMTPGDVLFDQNLYDLGGSHFHDVDPARPHHVVGHAPVAPRAARLTSVPARCRISGFFAPGRR